MKPYMNTANFASQAATKYFGIYGLQKSAYPAGYAPELHGQLTSRKALKERKNEK